MKIVRSVKDFKCMKNRVDDLVVTFDDTEYTVKDLNCVTSETTSIISYDKTNYRLVAVVLLVIACLVSLVVMVVYMEHETLIPSY